MFTGIVELTGTITAAKEVSSGRHLLIAAGAMAGECAIGASVCVGGVCLTVCSHDNDTLGFDVVRETLECSTLGAKSAGDKVNLERSLCVGDRLDGHFVQGHVDGTATVERIQASSREHVVWLRPADELVPMIVPKGSVTVDGVSLTVTSWEGSSFGIALIPTTLERTTLSSLGVGDPVNIETDIITRTILHRLGQLAGAGGITVDVLRKAGFA